MAKSKRLLARPHTRECLQADTGSAHICVLLDKVSCHPRWVLLEAELTQPGSRTGRVSASGPEGTLLLTLAGLSSLGPFPGRASGTRVFEELGAGSKGHRKESPDGRMYVTLTSDLRWSGRVCVGMKHPYHAGTHARATLIRGSAWTHASARGFSSFRG